MSSDSIPGFRGWYVVASAFSIMFLVFGCAYSFPAFFDSLQSEFKASRGDISFVFSISGLLFFGIGALTGPLADRFDVRKVIGFGVILCGAGFIMASFATALWQVLVAYGLGVGFGVGFAYVPSVGPVQRWFVRRRGFASGMAVAGIGVGTFAMPLIAAWLMTLQDWRLAYLAIGIATIILGLLAVTQMIPSPESVGQYPDGKKPPDEKAAAAAAAWPGLRLKDAVRTGPFAVLYLGTFLMSFPLFLPFVHLAPYVQDLGYGKSTAVFIVSLIGVGSIAGRFLLGGLADKFGRKQSLVAMFIGLTLMFGFWIVADTAAMLIVFALIYGTCYGGFVALVPAVTVDYLGVRNAGSIIGALYTSVAIGTFIGPPVMGYVFDATKSYQWALVGAVAMMALATLVIILLRDPEGWRAKYAARRAAG